MPEKITIRMVRGRALLVEFDDERVTDHGFESMLDDPTEVVKGIEVVLTALGYTPDLDGMYIDSDLMVLKFAKEDS